MLTVISLSAGNAPQAPKISTFCNHIEDVARQEKISFLEAATLVREMGYTGADVYTTQNPEELEILENLGFQHSCAIAEIDYSLGPQEEAEQKALDFLVKRNYDRVLLIPGLLKEDSTPEDLAVYKARVFGFVTKAKALGIDTTLEDYDNLRSPIHNIAGLSDFFSSCINVNHAYDSGNYLFCGEDCWEALSLFRDRITHVHLKDRISADNLGCPAVGTGCIPITALVQRLISTGYDGWYTAEMFFNRTMLESLRTSYDNIAAAIKLASDKMTPEMTEYYAPAVPVVTPDKVVYAKAPAGAKILFDGSSLSAWKSSRGTAAEWTLNGDGTMTVDKSKGDILTKEEFGSFLLHIEWMVPEGIQGSGQARGNSGVYIHNNYEVQVLDSYENPTYVNGQAGSIYKQSVPLANPCLAPGSWNVYDITFTAARVDASGNLLSNPRVTVVFNGVTVQDNFEILGTTEYIGLPKPVWTAKGPILLQSHGDRSQPISFRNIWIKEL